MTIQIQRNVSASTNYEYGCDLRRLYPSNAVDPIFWGCAIATLRPSGAIIPHSHDEEETFIILSGEGRIHVDGSSEEVTVGDVIYLPRESEHALSNGSDEKPLEFLTIFWGSPAAMATLSKSPDFKAVSKRHLESGDV